MTAQLPSRERLETLIRAIECESYDEEEIVSWVNSDEILSMARFALAAHEQEPVAWSVGGIATHDKKWAERRSAEDNLLMEPLYKHPIITGIDENHYDPELEPGLYIAEIMTNGGAAIINGYYTHPAPAPAVSTREKLAALQLASIINDLGLPENAPFVEITSEIFRLKQLESPVPAAPELVSIIGELTSAIRSINRAPHHIAKGVDDDEPCYWQRKEWIDWILELASSAEEKSRAAMLNGGKS